MLGSLSLLSAFLLFQVQPVISKFILPWFGGSPGVWTTCMVFFQALLFAGYAYAHLLTRLAPRTQMIVHGLLLLGAAACLPIAPDAAWKPSGGEDPSGRILLLLLGTVGLPYFVLSSTSPLAQVWFTRAVPGGLPWRLYALSNIGSLAALLSYPFLIEPRLEVITQTWIWSAAFILFAALSFVLARRNGRIPDAVAAEATNAATDAVAAPAPVRCGAGVACSGNSSAGACSGCCCRRWRACCCWPQPTMSARTWRWCPSCGWCRSACTC